MTCVGSDKGVVVVVLLLLVGPSVLVGSWITYLYVQPGVEALDENRVCHYKQEHIAIKSFFTRMGLEHETVDYSAWAIMCQGSTFAKMLMSAFPFVVQFGLPFLFMDLVLNFAKSVLHGRLSSETYIFVQLVFLDHFDVMDCLIFLGFPRRISCTSPQTQCGSGSCLV